MHPHITVQLPVADVARSRAFFSALGYTFRPEVTGDQAACVVLGENLYAMLLLREFFATLTPKTLVDARGSTEVAVCLGCDSREQVDTLVAKAVAAGGTAPSAATDYGFMYSQGFEDPDGHHWELVHMAGTPLAA
jgi:predicted lactoylglutathione lyase